MTASDPAPFGYTPAEAAVLCGVSIDTIRRYRKAGRFPRCVRIGDGANAAWRIPLEDLVGADLYVPGSPAEPVAASAPAATATNERPGEPPAAADADDRLAEAQEQVRWLREQNEQLLDLINRLTTSPVATPVTRLTTEPRSAA